MKKLLLSLSILFIAGIVSATQWDFTGQKNPNSPNMHVSEAVYISSNTATAESVVISSAYPAVLHTITVNKGGTSSFLDIWNTKVSSLAVGAVPVAKFDTTVENSYTFDIYLSSGLLYYNHGTVPADITITYRLK